ncbi:hypothetical protein GGR01_000563 [Acetobacter oeni]|nr:hypothetical protein [Acetobacter oeni]
MALPLEILRGIAADVPSDEHGLLHVRWNDDAIRALFPEGCANTVRLPELHVPQKNTLHRTATIRSQHRKAGVDIYGQG